MLRPSPPRSSSGPPLVSDRSELAEAARRCEQALIAARRAAFNAAAGELEALADALGEAAAAQADTAEILERVAPREPCPPEPRPTAGADDVAAAARARLLAGEAARAELRTRERSR